MSDPNPIPQTPQPTVVMVEQPSPAPAAPIVAAPPGFALITQAEAFAFKTATWLVPVLKTVVALGTVALTALGTFLATHPAFAPTVPVPTAAPVTVQMVPVGAASPAASTKPIEPVSAAQNPVGVPAPGNLYVTAIHPPNTVLPGWLSSPGFKAAMNDLGATFGVFEVGVPGVPEVVVLSAATGKSWRGPIPATAEAMVVKVKVIREGTDR